MKTKPIKVKRNGEVVVTDVVNGGRIKRILSATDNCKDLCDYLNKNHDEETIKRVEDFLQIGGALDVDQIKQEDIPKLEVQPLKTPYSTGVIMTKDSIPEPKGVHLYFHSGDLSPIELHGGASKATKWFRKLGREIKDVATDVGTEVKKVAKVVVKGTKRVFKPTKRSMDDYPLSSINPNEPAVPYITTGLEKRSDGTYEVVTCSFYYKDNPSIGIGWEFNPKDKKLGYHPFDVEFVSIYYLDKKPVKVFFSQHSVGKGEGVWVDYSQCQFKDGYLVVYVARNSHSNYPKAGTQVRVYGLANDETEATGPNKAYPFKDMNDSYDWQSSNGIKLYKKLRPAPPDSQMSQRERILRI